MTITLNGANAMPKETAALCIRFFVTSTRPTMPAVYWRLAGWGFKGEAAEDVLDMANISASPEQVSDLDPIIFRAVAL